MHVHMHLRTHNAGKRKEVSKVVGQSTMLETGFLRNCLWPGLAVAASDGGFSLHMQVATATCCASAAREGAELAAMHASAVPAAIHL